MMQSDSIHQCPLEFKQATKIIEIHKQRSTEAVERAA